MEVSGGVDVVEAADLVEGRQQAVGVVVDVIALPGVFGVAFVGGTGAQEKMRVAIGGLVAEALLENVEIGFVFDKAVERVGPGGELRSARFMIMGGGEAVGAM